MNTDWITDLEGETAIVTGGTRNIGLAIAQALRAHGAKVCIVGHQDREALDAALATLGDDAQATGLLAMVGDDGAAERIFDQTEARLGPVTILVNGAASRPHQPMAQISRADWDSVIGVILTGAFLMAQTLFRRLPEERRGAIVNLGGLSAHRALPERPHVIAAKAGLEGLTRALAAEGEGRVRANCVVPGAIDTKRRPGQSNPNDSGRLLGQPADIARAVLALADPAQVYLTGQTLHVNGGRFMN